MRGEIGEAGKKGHTKQEISKIEAETAVLETRRKGDKSEADAELTNRQTELDMGVQLAQIRARRAAEARDAELQKDVEQKKAETELERLRAKDVVKSKIQRETAQQETDANMYRDMKSADARNYVQKQNTEANYFSEVKNSDGRMYTNKQDAEIGLFKRTKEAEGEYIRNIKDADAAFYARKKEAEGIEAMAKAYTELGSAFGGPQGLLQYLMLKDNVYEKLALANAKAINGLQPKITVWNTGTDGTDSGSPIRNIMQSLPPLLSTIQEQTGITPPSWFAKMPQMPSSEERPHINGFPEKKSLVNGAK